MLILSFRYECRTLNDIVVDLVTSIYVEKVIEKLRIMFFSVPRPSVRTMKSAVLG